MCTASGGEEKSDKKKQKNGLDFDVMASPLL